jgi:hypothetical protein
MAQAADATAGGAQNKACSPLKGIAAVTASTSCSVAGGKARFLKLVAINKTPWCRR